MPHTDKLSMRAFWEAVEHRLAECGRDDLCAILRAMAQETPPGQRRLFLEKLARVEDTSEVSQRAQQQEELLADIEDLAQELGNAAEEAEEWEERDSWDEYDDEDSLGPYIEFVQPLTELFDRADAAFDYGHLALARAAYRELFSILDQEDDYGRGIGILNLDGVDAGETYARYLRAVYESEPLDGRPQALYTELRLIRLGILRPRPTLNDLVQISPHPLPDQERFLVDWIAFLRPQEEDDADALLREAVRLSQGTPGLEALARSEGQTRPRAYLDWCAALAQEDRPQEVLLAAQEALRVLPAGLSVRAEIADRLCAAAAQLDETEALRAGRWEAFRVQPTLSRLLDLRDTGADPSERTALMQQVALQSDVPDGERAIRIKQPVLAHTFLLATKFDAASRLVQDQMVLGWSSQSSAQGMVVACLLVLLSQSTLDTLPSNLDQVWQWGLDYSTGSWYAPGENPLKKRLQRAYAELFSQPQASDYRSESLLAWCLSVIQQRVNAIVGGQKRGAYDKAAVLTVAGAETLRRRGDRAAADALVQEIRGRFPRHSAFQRMFRQAY